MLFYFSKQNQSILFSTIWLLIGKPHHIYVTNKLWHEISNNVVYATSNGSDQPAHTHSLIKAFASALNILWLLNYWPNNIWSFSALKELHNLHL